jgi:uncharacterized protein YjbI with pentapeptide repeats
MTTGTIIINEYTIEKKANLSYANLPEIKVWDKDLNAINFSYATLRNSDFTFSAFKKANFSCTDLEGVKFAFSNLKFVNFKYANLKGCDFSYANLYKTDFTGADIRGCNFYGTKHIATMITKNIVNGNMESVAEKRYKYLKRYYSFCKVYFKNQLDECDPIMKKVYNIIIESAYNLNANLIPAFNNAGYLLYLEYLIKIVEAPNQNTQIRWYIRKQLNKIIHVISEKHFK